MEDRVEFVSDLNLFFEKSEYGVSHVYQLHRELGGVFIDASFHDDTQTHIFKTRIDIASPHFIVSELKWDEQGFPYELETYQVDNQEITVPLYRPFGPVFDKFLLDVAIDITSPDPIGAPTDIVSNCHNIVNSINKILEFLYDLKLELGDKERRAIDTFFGDVGIWDRSEYNVYEALVSYLSTTMLTKASKYYEIAEKINKQRHDTLLAAVNSLVDKVENTLKNHNFKKGFISS